MSVSKILRIVDINGQGMHRAGGTSLAERVMYNSWISVDNSKHPLPFDDKSLWEWWVDTESMEDCLFAFSDRDQYLRWVYDPQWRKEFENLGAKLLVISIDEGDHCKGERQAIYKRAEVIAVKEFSPYAFDDPILEKEINDYLQSI